MKLIKDIRLFELDVPNIDYNPTPNYIGKMYHYDHIDCLDVIQRLLFLLRHRGFGYDGFDHLYLNFTPCIPHSEIRDVNRHNIREFSWFQYVDVGCDVELFNSWTLYEQTAFILEAAKNASIMKSSKEMRQIFENTFNEVIEKGATLLLPYKQKKNENYLVEIMVRINDELDFLPLIRVTDKEGTVRAEQELRSYGRDEFITQISTITIGKAHVRISPRKNYDTEYYGLTPIRIEW